MCAWVKNRNRRSRPTGNPSKRSEAPANAIRRASSAPSYSSVPRNVKAAAESESIVERQDEKKLTNGGRFKVTADKFPTSAGSPSRGIWFFDWEALRGKTDHKQPLQSKDLHAQQKEIAVPVTQNGIGQKLPTHDLSIVEIVHLKSGDQVPADGLLIIGDSFSINLSTADSKPVHASGVGIPFRLPGKEGQYLITQDACDPCSNDSAASDNHIYQLVRDLNSRCLDKQKQAALKIRLLAKNKAEDCIRIAQAGVIEPLITLISSSDPAVTARKNFVGVQNGDGLLNTGSPLDTNESSLTGESKSVPVSDRSPSRLSERKVQDGIMQDASEHSRSESSHLLIAGPSDINFRQLIHDLNSDCLDKQKGAARKIRRLVKKDPENRVYIARADAIKPLIALILSPDPEAQEDSVTAILNLSICDENKELIVASGAIELLVRALSMGMPTVKENAACTLLKLSKDPKNKGKIGRSGAILPLVNLLKSGQSQGKKNALRALDSLCSENENRVRAVRAGAMRPLVEQMVDPAVERAVIVVSRLVGAAEAREALVKEGGIPVLVKMVKEGTQRQKKIAVGVLLQLADSVEYQTKVCLARATVPLMALVQSGANPGKQKVRRMW